MAQVSVRIPAPLRKFTATKSAVTLEGATVGAVLTALATQFDGLKPTIYDGAGNLRNFINVFVGEQNIRDAQGLDTPVTEGAEISIVPAIAGGR